MSHTPITMSTIHFAHANGFPSPTYAPFLQALQQQGYQVDYIEKIGHNSGFPITNNWPHLVEELRQDITRKHQQPITGIGHSAGGLLHYLLAQQQPGLYSQLILLDPPVINGWQNIIWWLAKRFGQTDRFTPARQSRNRRTHYANLAEARERLGNRKLFKPFSAASFEAYLEHGLYQDETGRLTLAFNKEKELKLFRTAADDLWRYRTPLKMPGLYLTAEGSEFSGMPFAHRLAKKNRMAYRVVKGGHLFPQERPQETAEVIIDWLNKNGPSPQT